MKEDFQNIKSQVRVEDLAVHLLGQPIRNMFRYPGERTPSIKIYVRSQSFFDFGRNRGGDAIALWSHVRGCNSWEALRQIKTTFGIEEVADKENIYKRIRQQEKVRKAAEQAENERKLAWIKTVERLKAEIEMYDNILQSPHIPPLSWAWTWCKNGKHIAEHKLDVLCGSV